MSAVWTPEGAAISQRERTSGRNPAALTRFSSESGMQLALRLLRGKSLSDLPGHFRRMSEVNGTIWLVCGPDARFE
jgi:hypothetical protein